MRRQDGAVLVEFALILVPLLLLAFGVLQFGIAMNAKIDSTHLTAEGARYIAVNQNPGLSQSPPQTMQSYIRSRADTPRLKTAAVCINYLPNPETGTTGQVGDPVQVTLGPVSYLPFIGTLPGGITLPTATVASEATMRLEAQPTNIPEGCIS
ncbi:MAG: TadE/TadG family type IV pilus assembly protein [Thermoleophilaceae bacterium]